MALATPEAAVRYVSSSNRRWERNLGSIGGIPRRERVEERLALSSIEVFQHRPKPFSKPGRHRKSSANGYHPSVLRWEYLKVDIRTGDHA